MKRYARKGELITCPNGHDIGEFAQDVYLDQEIDFRNHFIFKDANSTRSVPICPKCNQSWITSLNLFFINGTLRTIDLCKEIKSLKGNQ
jgi:hypothetical protein